METFSGGVTNSTTKYLDVLLVTLTAAPDLLDEMIPACEIYLSSVMDPLFKIFRDDGLGITFDGPEIIAKILEFFNSFEPSIKWTIPSCPHCLQPQVLCHH